MQEKQLSVGTRTISLDEPFCVMATQNPVEQEGTYPLPEAQLDRFLFKLRVGYPSADDEVRMLRRRLSATSVEHCVSPEEVVQIRSFISSTIRVDDRVSEYIVRLGRATRSPDEVGCPDLKELILLGVSPRSYQHMLALAKVSAFLRGGTYVLPEDVKEILCDVARHRIIRTVRAQAENVDVDEILHELARTVPIP